MKRRYVSRDGIRYKVVDEAPGQVCVMVEMNYADPPYKRKVRTWWYLKDCDTETSTVPSDYMTDGPWRVA